MVDLVIALVVALDRNDAWARDGVLPAGSVCAAAHLRGLAGRPDVRPCQAILRPAAPSRQVFAATAWAARPRENFIHKKWKRWRC
jgi:hypothetical protein